MLIPNLSSRASCDEVVRALDTAGCVVVHDLFPEDRIAQLHRDLDWFFASTPIGEGIFFGRRTKRFGGIMAKSPCCIPLVVTEAVLEPVTRILRRACDSIQLNLTQAIQIHPGEPRQIFHKDDELYPFEKNGCQFTINAMWALDPFTADNGATLVVPGSHLRAVNRDPHPADVVPAEMPAGSVLIYLGSVDHCGGANRTMRPRTGVVFSYCLGWLRQTENQYLSMPPEKARRLSEQLQRLLGYAIHRPNLGWYEGQDPIVTLGENVPSTLPAKDYFSPEAEAEVMKLHKAIVDRQPAGRAAVLT